jgi:hypothetical protein
VSSRRVSGFTFTALSAGNRITAPGKTEDACALAKCEHINQKNIEDKRNFGMDLIRPNLRLTFKIKVFINMFNPRENKFLLIFFIVNDFLFRILTKVIVLLIGLRKELG